MRRAAFIKKKRQKEKKTHKKTPPVNSELSHWRITARLNEIKGKTHKLDTS